ncbi:hypothetical protein [Paenibacillus tengchongensis]|uniref:hypothetical protein n=1 Tax=Paenibacillus tengchongensis TaxID=2608684 RepID=UPI00124EB09F|nr:hypothetical protein [Paenibacillus tengchongensis]
MLYATAIICAAAGIALLLAAAVLQFRQPAPSAPAVNMLARSLAGFNLNCPKQFITPDQSHIIALDESGKSMAVGTYLPGAGAPPVAKLYSFDAILGSELVENALTLSKVSKTSRITSSQVRSNFMAHHGPASAAAPEPAEEVNELVLKIYLQNEDTPVLSIPFLPGQSPARKTDPQYNEAIGEARHVHEMIRGIVSA